MRRNRALLLALALALSRSVPRPTAWRFVRAVIGRSSIRDARAVACRRTPGALDRPGALESCVDSARVAPARSVFDTRRPDNATEGCLFDLRTDPAERRSRAAEQSALFGAMVARVAELQAGVYSPDRGEADAAACARATGANGGYWGPWLP